MKIVVHTQSLVPIAQLNPVAYNPRKISAEKFEALKDSIKSDGFVDPIVVQKSGMRIIGGHQRYRAMKEICTEANIEPPSLPCTVLDIDDTKAKKLNIKLNSLKGEFDPRMLGELLVDIFEEPKYIQLDNSSELGFEVGEVKRFIQLADPEFFPAPDPITPTPLRTRTPSLTIEFASVEMRERTKKALQDRMELEKKKTGDIVADALGLTRTRVRKKKKATRKRSAA